MATSSYANLFGTTGAGQQGSKAGIGTMFGQQARPDDEEQRRRQQAQQGQAPTFAQMQQAGQARPAPQQAQMAVSVEPPPMIRQLQQQLRPAQPAPGTVATRGQAAAPPPTFDAVAAQRAAMQRQPRPQPAPTAAPSGFAPTQGGEVNQMALSTGPMQMEYATAQPGGQTITERQFGAPQMQTQPPATAPAPIEMYQGLLGQLQQQLGQQFAQPSGYTTPEFQQLRQAQLGNLQAEFQGQQQALNEELARRGLSASSIGAGRMGDLAGQQARAMAGLEAQLLQQQAEAGQRGRETALGTLAQVTGQLGQQTLGQQEVGLRASEIQQRGEQFGLQLSEQQADRLQRLGISTQELGLRAQQLQQEAAQQGRQLDITEAQNLAQNELEGRRIELSAEQLGQQQRQFEATLGAEESRFARNLTEQQNQRLQQLGVSTRQLDLDAARLRQDAELQGRSLGLQEARDLAEKDYRAKSLQQQAELEGRRLTNEEARLKADNEFRTDQLKQQNDQFTANLGAEEQRFVRTLKEQQDARAQQLGISTKELDLRATQIGNEYERSGQTLTLQEKRDEAEARYRTESLVQQATLAGRQIDAEKTLQDERLKVQQAQMTIEEALRREGIAVDRERLASAERQFDAEQSQRREALTEQSRQFGATMGFQQEQANRSLAMQLADIFSKSDDPEAAKTLAPILQALMASLPGYQAPTTGGGGGGGGGAGGGETGGGATGGAAGGATGGTVGGATGGGAIGGGTVAPQIDFGMPLDFSQILKFGTSTYNPYTYNAD
jgi:hypothetical protein